MIQEELTKLADEADDEEEDSKKDEPRSAGQEVEAWFRTPIVHADLYPALRLFCWDQKASICNLMLAVSFCSSDKQEHPSDVNYSALYTSKR